MKLAVISDTHLSSPTKYLEEIYYKYMHDADLILHAGDIVTSEVLDFFPKEKTVAVRGNMDREDLIYKLPEKKIIEVKNFRIGIVHGWGAPFGMEKRVFEVFKEEKVDCIVFGHTHNGVNHKKEGILLFNPGSPTDRFFAKQNSIGILHIENEIKGEIIFL